MVREFIAKINRALADNLVPRRKRFTAPVKVWFDPLINTERERERARSACLLGEIVDLSRTGIAFLVPAIRINERYLVGQEQNVNVEIDLPTGKVHMQIVGKRYEKVGIHLSIEKFLVGAQISKMSDGDRESYEYFLKSGRRRKKGAARVLELGVD